MSKTLRSMLVTVSILGSGSQAAYCGAEADISELLYRTFDKPESRLTVSPVVVMGDDAVAGWTQGAMGSRALLRGRHGQWTIVLCSGDAIRSASALTAAGVPPENAQRLAAGLQSAEAALPHERVMMLSRFEGTLMMNEGEAHPHSHAKEAR